MAETVLRAELAEAGLDGAVVVDSAGTGDWHVGDAMDPGAREALASPRSRTARRTGPASSQPSWLAERDLILAMDARNLANLRRMAAGKDARPDPAIRRGRRADRGPRGGSGPPPQAARPAG